MFDLTNPSWGYTGKILSTRRLYLGLKALQQPQQPAKKLMFMHLKGERLQKEKLYIYHSTSLCVLI